MARELKYFSIHLGPIGYTNSYPAMHVNGREVMPPIPSGPSDGFYVHRAVTSIDTFCEYHNIVANGPELYADCVFTGTSKSAVKKALSAYFAGIKLDQIKETS